MFVPQTTEPSIDEKVAFLRDARTHGHGNRKVEVLETHFAWLFLTESLVYKLKKPVRRGSMNYLALASRERGCRDEVRLNRRLAPDVYLSVVPLTSIKGVLELEGAGEVVDWVVKMRRLPQDRMLDGLLRKGQCASSDIAALVEVLARFYQRAVHSPIEAADYISRIQARVLVNQSDLLRHASCVDSVLVNQLASLQFAYIAEAGSTLGPRGEHVVEGHGDLRAEHVCLSDRVNVIDCLEFNRDLRLCDPLDDLALLALEIERLGGEPLARLLWRRFNRIGVSPADERLMHFHMSLRALSQARLAAWHLGDPEFPDARPWIERAKALLMSGWQHARAAAL